MSRLYAHLDGGETIEPGDETGLGIPVADEFFGQPMRKGWVVRRPVNGYVVDLDGVEPMPILTGVDGTWVCIDGDLRNGVQARPDEAEARALRILAAVAKVRAS